VADARKRGFPHKVKVLPERIIMNMAIPRKPGGTDSSYRWFGYERIASGYDSIWCTEFEEVGNRE
jgi:hypothetical protein